MSTILQQIGDVVQKRIDLLKNQVSLSQLKTQAELIGYQPKHFADSFLENGVNVIAEYKRASPSKGDIALNLDALTVAEEYISSGAKALSILTEPSYFKGDIQFIRSIKQKFPSSNILMKDFFVDEYQLYQALEAQTDAILIIVGLLGKEKSLTLHRKAKELGLTTLVEVHDAEELKIGLDLGPDLLGVNNRDLRDLTVTIETSLELAKLIPSGQISVSESGIKSGSDIKILREAGFNGFLIGTSLMATGHPGQALATLMESS